VEAFKLGVLQEMGIDDPKAGCPTVIESCDEGDAVTYDSSCPPWDQELLPWTLGKK